MNFIENNFGSNEKIFSREKRSSIHREAGRMKNRSGNIDDLDLPIASFSGDGSVRIRTHRIGFNIQLRFADNAAVMVPFSFNGFSLPARNPHPAIDFIRSAGKRNSLSDNLHFIHIGTEFEGFNFHSVHQDSVNRLGG